MCRYQLIYFVTHAVVRLNQSSTTTKLQIAQLIQSSKNRSKQRTLQNLSLLIPWGSSPLPLGCKPPECINRGRLDDWQLASNRWAATLAMVFSLCPDLKHNTTIVITFCNNICCHFISMICIAINIEVLWNTNLDTKHSQVFVFCLLPILRCC